MSEGRVSGNNQIAPKLGRLCHRPRHGTGNNDASFPVLQKDDRAETRGGLVHVLSDTLCPELDEFGRGGFGDCQFLSSKRQNSMDCSNSS